MKIIFMNSSTFPWLIYTYLIFSFLLTSFLSSAATQISYTDHCNSFVPESNRTRLPHAFLSFLQPQLGYYIGGNRILYQNPSDNSHSLTFHPQYAYATDRDGVFGIDGFLELRSRNTFYVGNDPYTNSLSFRLHGFWSESSGKICMVGKGFTYNRKGQFLNFEGVLKLTNFKNSSSVTTLVTGTLDSLSSTNDLSYFEPISILILPRNNYAYTLVSKEFNDDFSGGSDGGKSTLPISSMRRGSFCMVFSRTINEFDLKYTSDCRSAKNCTPFGGDDIGYLPLIISFRDYECSEEEKKMRVLVKFSDISYVGFYKPFNPNTALVGEVSWDNKTNQLYVVACRFLNTTESLVNAQVGDCTTRLSLSFPAIRTIRETSDIVGKIWSNKAVNDSGHFDAILFRSSVNGRVAGSGLKYEYTEMTRVRGLCLPKKELKKNKEERYPDGNSDDMVFDIRVRKAKGNSSFGFAAPVAVGDRFYKWHSYPPESVAHENFGNSNPVNISYRVGVTTQLGKASSSSYERVEISSEGIYDEETGRLCMVGCRNIVNDSMDCEILIKFQFPPLNPRKNEGYIKGRIKSTRVESDPLYFEPLDVSSVTYSTTVMTHSISRMDLEIIMALISNTLVCAFVGLQIFHVKKNPHVLPSISLVMLLILTLSHMIPLVLNFEALFRDRQNALVDSGGWVEVNEVLVRIVTMVAFLLEFRLLQLSWSGRLANANKTGLWFAEKWTLFVSLPLYAAGFVIVLLSSHDSIWKDLKSYAGLILDGFLLPQILFNIFANSEQNALSCSFYIGTTFVRLLPHVYDLYRTYSYNLLGSYIYAVPNEDFYSTGWDVTIPLGGLLFAAIIYLQQRFGGRGTSPGKFGEGDAYENVPVVSES